MNLNDFYEHRNDYFLKMPSSVRLATIVFMVIGAGAFAAAQLLGEPTRAWGALLFNTLFFYSLALGGVILGAVQDVVGAVWGRPIRRIHEAFAAFLTPASIILAVFLIAIKFKVAGAGDVYVWIKNPAMLAHFPGKNIWLQENFMIARDLVILAILWITAKWQLKMSIERDLILISGNKDKAMEVGLLAKKKLRFFTAPILFVYGTGLTFLHFDLTMSLEPLWFSTLWGGWLFAILMHTLMASMLLAMFYFQKNASFGSFIKQHNFHDIGKMMHGFTAFFGYLTYAHVLTYWYGNIPEETEFFIHRLHAPWIYFLFIILAFAFVIPMFALVPKASKWTKSIAVPLASIILFAQWCTYLMLVMPVTAKAETFKFPYIEMGLFLGIAGIFIMGIFRFGAKVPMVCIADPLLPKALHEHH